MASTAPTEWTATVRDSEGGIHASHTFALHPGDDYHAALTYCYRCWSPAGIYSGQVEPSLEVTHAGVTWDIWGKVVSERDRAA